MILIKKYFSFIIVVLLFLLQLPFLKADPDRLADTYSRGAWADEGLYVSQTKNLVNHGSFDIKETDGFVKAPLFNIIMIPFFYVFGTSLAVSRSVTLFITLFVLFFFLKNEKLRVFGIFLTLFALLEFHVFQFSHFGLAEMVSVSFIFSSLYFFYLSKESAELHKKIKLLFLSALFIFLCYFNKVSFLYTAGIMPVAVFLSLLNESWRKRKLIKKDYYIFSWSLIFTLFFLLFYFICWYLPFRDSISYVLTVQGNALYSPALKTILADAWYIFLREFWIEIFRINIIHFLIILICAFVLLIIKRKKSPCSALFIFSFVWILFELHKLPLLYLPYRYIISLICAAGVFISAMYFDLFFRLPKLKYFFLFIAIAFGIYNLKFNYDAFNRRTYQLMTVNKYLAKYDLKNKPVIGPWASSVCWENKAITFPVWYNYFNWKDPIKKYRPAIVVTEIDELDSDFAYKNAGIDLKKASDSCRVFDVCRYKLVVYWIH